MRYNNILPAVFLDRPNRFIAHAELNGEMVVCHVKNTGRCRELLVPGCTVYLQDHGALPKRKTRYDLIAVEKLRPGKAPLLVNMDSQAPNKVFAEWANSGGFLPNLTLLRPETTWGGSRFDFYYETAAGEKGFVEIKGCTLEENGLASFPDAPTVRGVKHLDELTRAASEGYAAHICFILQMEGMKLFCPNERTHPEFGEALRRAAESGVFVHAMECTVTPDTLTVSRSVPISLTFPTQTDDIPCKNGISIL